MDASARETTPHLLKIVMSIIDDEEFNFSYHEKQDVRFMIDLLKDFKGDMSLDSIGATVYSYWHYHFMQSFLKAYTVNGKIG